MIVRKHRRKKKKGFTRVRRHNRKMSKKTRKKISEAMTGSNNHQYIDGRRSFRRIAGAKPGQHVHHEDGDSTNNNPTNLKLFSNKGKSRSEHERMHQRELNFNLNGGRKKVERGYSAQRMIKW